MDVGKTKNNVIIIMILVLLWTVLGLWMLRAAQFQGLLSQDLGNVERGGGINEAKEERSERVESSLRGALGAGGESFGGDEWRQLGGGREEEGRREGEIIRLMGSQEKEEDSVGGG